MMNRYVVHLCTNQNDLRTVWNIDVTEYGDMNVDFTLLHEWWRKFQHGHHIIRNGEEIIGGFGLWPLSKNSYRKLQRGSITEAGINILHPNKALGNKFWYLSGIILKPEYRKKRAAWHLIHRVMTHWRVTWVANTYGKTIAIGAIPISKDGLDMMTRFAFDLVHSAEQRNDHYPFYEKIVNITKPIIEYRYRQCRYFRDGELPLLDK